MRQRRRGQKAIKSKELIVDDVEQELYIEDEHINEELMDQPLKFRKWSKIEVECERQVKTLKLSLENAEAQAYADVKEEYQVAGEKPTVKDLDTGVKLNPEVKRIKQELLDAEAQLADVKLIVRAFYQRHEVLKDIAANLRKDLLD